MCHGVAVVGDNRCHRFSPLSSFYDTITEILLYTSDDIHIEVTDTLSQDIS